MLNRVDVVNCREKAQAHQAHLAESCTRIVQPQRKGEQEPSCRTAHLVNQDVLGTYREPSSNDMNYTHRFGGNILPLVNVNEG